MASLALHMSKVSYRHRWGFLELKRWNIHQGGPTIQML